MNDTRLHRFARGVRTAQDRRASLKALGVAALAGISAAPLSAGAGPKRKERCRKQAKRCRNFVLGQCEGKQDCEDRLLPCCKLGIACNADTLYDCALGLFR